MPLSTNKLLKSINQMKNESISKTNRLILINQYEILKHLNTDLKEHYDKMIKILENGFNIEYDGKLFQFISDEISSDICEETINLLSMFSNIEDSMISLKLSNEQINSLSGLHFMGFDNQEEEEAMYYSYSKFLTEDDRFIWFKNKISGKMGHLEIYRILLGIYNDNKFNTKNELSLNDLKMLSQKVINEYNNPSDYSDIYKND
jgi:hypothetical protein